MKKANLYCPSHQVFFKNLLVNTPILPGNGLIAMTQEPVSILEVIGNQALVLLPEIMANSQRTALVDLQYLS